MNSTMTKLVAAILLLAAAAFGGYKMAMAATAAQITAAEETARQRALEAAEARGQAKAATEALGQLQARTQAMEAKLDAVRAKVDAIPIPPKPGPAPAEALQVAKDLRDMGMTPATEVKPIDWSQPTTLGMRDGQLVWTWGKEAKRVPGLELKISGFLEEREADKDVHKAFTEERAQAHLTIGKWQGAADTERAARVATEDANKGLHKALVQQERQKWLYGIGGIVLGALVVDRVKR